MISGMLEWRLQDPKATMAEIEAELDQRLACGETRMIADATPGQPERRLGERERNQSGVRSVSQSIGEER